MRPNQIHPASKLFCNHAFDLRVGVDKSHTDYTSVGKLCPCEKKWSLTHLARLFLLQYAQLWDANIECMRS